MGLYNVFYFTQETSEQNWTLATGHNLKRRAIVSFPDADWIFDLSNDYCNLHALILS